MKTKQLLFIAAAFAICLITLQANAKIWRVNNLSNYDGTTLFGDNLGGTSLNPVFAQLSDANIYNQVSLSAIDTVHLEGTNIIYNGVILTKKMIIIGPGYFLNENPDVSNTVMEAEINFVQFSGGTDGSQLIGVHIGNNGAGIDINNVSDILIKRCRIDYDVYAGFNNTDITIEQNYFSNAANNSVSAITISGAGFPSHFVFNNNICKKTLLLSAGTTIYNAQDCNNNIFDCPAIAGNPSIEMNVSSFKNNILKTTGATVNINSNIPGSGVAFNISSATSGSGQFGINFNNIVVTNMPTIFVDPVSNTTDGDYQLKPGSAGSNNGSDGTDRGVFGGEAVTNHYTLSGLAPIPVIYNVTTSGVSGPSGLNVTIKARTIK